MSGAEGAGLNYSNYPSDGGQPADSAGYDGGSSADDDGVVDSPSYMGVSCSICLEVVADDGSRSRAKLHCGHEFHLDCIGSAFNMKGDMQCPNCRKIEKGQWLYANGSPRPLPELFMEDWIPDEDLYGLSYPEMHYRFHWCPFGELSHAAASFEELESPTTTFPVTTTRTNENADDHPWNNHSGQTENFNRLAVAAPYLGWDHRVHSHSFPLPSGHLVTADPVPAEVNASARPRPYPHPFLFGYRPNPRSAPAVHRHPGNSTVTRERLHASHLFSHQQQPGNGPNLASPLIPLTRRGVAPPPPEQSSGFFVFPHPISSSSHHHEAETDHFQTWERDWFPHFPVSSRETGWGSSNHRTPSNFWQRHFS